MPQNSECSELCDVRIPSVSFADSVPTPFGPSGHFPLIGGIGPLCQMGSFFGEPAVGFLLFFVLEVAIQGQSG